MRARRKGPYVALRPSETDRGVDVFSTPQNQSRSSTTTLINSTRITSNGTSKRSVWWLCRVTSVAVRLQRRLLRLNPKHRQLRDTLLIIRCHPAAKPYIWRQGRVPEHPLTSAGRPAALRGRDQERGGARDPHAHWLFSINGSGASNGWLDDWDAKTG